MTSPQCKASNCGEGTRSGGGSSSGGVSWPTLGGAIWPTVPGASWPTLMDQYRANSDNQDEQMVAAHQLQSASAGWVTVREHHTTLWQDALAVEQRPLTTYEEVGQWN